MKNGFKKIKKAFTLVELVVVIAIIAILSAVSVAGYFGLTKSAKSSAAKQELKQVMDQYTNYQILNSSNSYADIYEGCDGFVYYLIENEPVFSNKLNYTVDAEQISYVKSRNSYTVKKANDAGNVTFLIKTSSSYFATFSVPYSGSKLGSISESVNTQGRGGRIHKSLQKATDAVFEGENVSVDNWEYKVETSGIFVEDPNRYTINLYNNDLNDSSHLSTIVLRGSKNLDKVGMDRAVTIVDYYAYDTEVEGSFYQDGSYFKSSVSSWNYYDQGNLKEWDFSNPINSDLSLISKTELNESYNEVTRIIRDNGEEYKRFDKGLPDEKITSSSYRSYHFDDVESAIEFANIQTVSRTYYLYEVTEKSDGCDTTYTPANEPYGTSVEDGFAVEEEIQIRSRNAVIDKDVTLKAGTYISLEYAEGRSGYGYAPVLLNGKSWYEYVEKGVLENHEAYSTLTVSEGVNFDVYGRLTVGAFATTYKNFVMNYVYVNESAADGEEKGGFAHLINNGKIQLHNSAILESYGYVTGSGSIDAMNGSAITDLFTIYNWPGGSAASTVYKTSFIFNEYTINNIRCTSNIYYGAKYNADAVIYAPTLSISEHQTLSIVGSDSSSLFTLTNTSELGNNSYIKKSSKFDIERNSVITNIEMYGNAYENYFSIDSFTLEQVYFPVYKMDITIQSGTFEVKNNKFMIMPGSRVKVAAGAKIIVSNNGSFAIMDELNYNNNATFEYNGFDVPGVLEIDGSIEVETSVTGVVTINQGGSYKLSPACSYTANVTYGMGMITKVSNAYPLATDKTVLTIIDKNNPTEFYTICFQSEVGVSVETKLVEKDSTVSLLNPTQEGYTFVGWYTTSTFDENTKVDSEIVVKSSMILYAKWIENTTTENVL